MLRRNFLHHGTLAAVATFLFPAAGILRAATAERTAVDFLRQFSDRLFLRTGAAAGLTRYVALVRDLASFSAAFHRAPAAGIADLRVAGTVATFRVDGRLFEVENLQHEDFTAHLAEPAGNLLAVNA